MKLFRVRRVTNPALRSSLNSGHYFRSLWVLWKSYTITQSPSGDYSERRAARAYVLNVIEDKLDYNFSFWRRRRTRASDEKKKRRAEPIENKTKYRLAGGYRISIGTPRAVETSKPKWCFRSRSHSLFLTMFSDVWRKRDDRKWS